MGYPLKDEAAMAEQLMRRHGNSAVLQASETATALHAMGDEEGAARWRRIRILSWAGGWSAPAAPDRTGTAPGGNPFLCQGGIGMREAGPMANLSSNPQSTAKIFGHPLHPMLVPFPIAGFVGALVCDLIYRPGGDIFWFRASEYLLGAGVVMALVAAVFGFIDLISEARIRALTVAWVHFLGNLVVVLTEAFNWYRRESMGEQAMAAGMTLSLVAVLLMLITGWLGWEMVYRRRVGIADTIT